MIVLFKDAMRGVKAEWVKLKAENGFFPSTNECRAWRIVQLYNFVEPSKHEVKVANSRGSNGKGNLNIAFLAL